MAAQTKAPSNPFRSVTRFCQETMEELRKATWPTWLELRDSTILIIFTVLLFGLMLWVVDDVSFSNDIRFLSHLASGR